jgi:sugar/nucleoside kinase (ribokinase family)
MSIAAGGAVANTGLAAHRLGLTVRLMSLVGEDALGQLILDTLSKRDPGLITNVRVLPGQPSSYSIVLSPGRADRLFLHCPGTNALFGREHINFDVAAQARIVHLGYPPILPRLIRGDGEELARVFAEFKAHGAVTSLDMCMPDVHGEAGRADWRAIFRNTLKYVDIFVPSYEEIVFTLRRDDFDKGSAHMRTVRNRDYVRSITEELIEMGVAVAGVKCGADGLFLQTASKLRIDGLRDRLSLPPDWDGASAWHPAFAVQVVGTTGAGDAAYAAILASMLRSQPISQTARWACAVGACNVEAADAESGILPWETIAQRLAAGWQTLPSRLS